MSLPIKHYVPYSVDAGRPSYLTILAPILLLVLSSCTTVYTDLPERSDAERWPTFGAQEWSEWQLLCEFPSVVMRTKVATEYSSLRALRPHEIDSEAPGHKIIIEIKNKDTFDAELVSVEIFKRWSYPFSRSPAEWRGFDFKYETPPDSVYELPDGKVLKSFNDPSAWQYHKSIIHGGAVIRLSGVAERKIDFVRAKVVQHVPRNWNAVKGVANVFYQSRVSEYESYWRIPDAPEKSGQGYLTTTVFWNRSKRPVELKFLLSSNAQDKLDDIPGHVGAGQIMLLSEQKNEVMRVVSGPHYWISISPMESFLR